MLSLMQSLLHSDGSINIWSLILTQFAEEQFLGFLTTNDNLRLSLGVEDTVDVKQKKIKRQKNEETTKTMGL